MWVSTAGFICEGRAYTSIIRVEHNGQGVTAEHARLGRANLFLADDFGRQALTSKYTVIPHHLTPASDFRRRPPPIVRLQMENPA